MSEQGEFDTWKNIEDYSDPLESGDLEGIDEPLAVEEPPGEKAHRLLTEFNRSKQEE